MPETFNPGEDAIRVVGIPKMPFRRKRAPAYRWSRARPGETARSGPETQTETPNESRNDHHAASVSRTDRTAAGPAAGSLRR